MESWIKVRGALHDDPKVVRMAQAIVADPNFVEWAAEPFQLHQGKGVEHDNALSFMSFQVVLRCVTSALVSVWATANQHGKIRGLNVTLENTTRYGLNALAGVPGITEVMESVGWAIVDQEKEIVTFPRFLTYNIPYEDRKRVQAKARQQRRRERIDQEARDKRVTKRVTVTRDCHADVTPSETETETETEEERKTLSHPCERAGFDPVVDRWNLLAEHHLFLRPIRGLSEDRRRKFTLRLKEHPDWWAEVEEEMERVGPWAREHNFLSFDWLLSPANLTKFLEGNYRDRGGPPSKEEVDALYAKADESRKEMERGFLE